jgi:hypothetical protein
MLINQYMIAIPGMIIEKRNKKRDLERSPVSYV